MALYVRARLTKSRIHQTRFTSLVTQVLSAVGESESELSVELVGDRRMRRLNHLYRRKDRTTDVLAFAMRESDSPCSALLGDVVISVPTARRQASQAGRSLDEELIVLLIHGVLHLCGYDHERGEREAARMQRRERAILKALRPLPSLVAGVTTTKRNR
jgi:probable rRNA maturation factor